MTWSQITENYVANSNNEPTCGFEGKFSALLDEVDYLNSIAVIYELGLSSPDHPDIIP